ncbi:hypothetical protein [Robertmurraya massiliosenegalensis]|uniref:hypothetical protein n=1 Tax=Robertmurraya massiliosenegalensis TaxID=1287657 RepID=UPI0003767DD8|nr:hypothetical protein [Robertmurraya massiliosenegalensis]
MNLVEEALNKISQLEGHTIKNGEQFDCLPIVDSLLDKRLITWDTYHLFISEERSYGSIPGVIKDGVFSFPFKHDQDVYIPENDMYNVLCNLINFILKK